jgi:hypothetical protein
MHCSFLWRRLARSPAASCFVWPWRRPHCLPHGRFACLPAVPVAFSRRLSLSSSVRSADFFHRPLGCLPSDRGRSRTSAAVDCCGVGVRRVLLSGVVLRDSLSILFFATLPPIPHAFSFPYVMFVSTTSVYLSLLFMLLFSRLSSNCICLSPPCIRTVRASAVSLM